MFGNKPKHVIEMSDKILTAQELIKQIDEEAHYLVSLQRKHLESVFDPLHSWVVQDEIEQTQESLYRKDQIVKTLYKIAQFERSNGLD